MHFPCQSESDPLEFGLALAEEVAIGFFESSEVIDTTAVRNYAVEVLQAGVIVCDLSAPDLPIIYVNRGFERMTGYPEVEVLGQNCRFLQGPETDPAVVSKVRETIAARESTTVILRNYRKDGTAFWNQLQLSPYRDKSDNVTHYIGVQTDVSDRIEAERDLVESQNQLALLLDSTAEAIYGLDTAGDCTFCNAACAQMLGYDSPEELLGKNMHELIHSVTSDGKPHSRESCKIYEAFARNEGTHSDSEVFWRKDGTAVPVEYWSYPIRRDGAAVGAVVSFLDISERQQAAQRLLHRTRMLETVNQINLALAGELDLDRLVKQVTDAGCILTGAEYGAFLFVDTDGEVVSDDDTSRSPGAMRLQALSGITEDELADLPLLTPVLFEKTYPNAQSVCIEDLADHAELEIDTRKLRSYLSVPVVSRSAQTVGVLVFGHRLPKRFDESHQHLVDGIAAQAAVAIDNAQLYEETQRELHERRQIEKALDEARRAADLANRSKTEFLANMSHEIRTPMTAILGYADILAAHLDNPDNRECVDTIKRNGRFLLNIVDDILDLSRIEAGKLRVQYETFRIDELIADVRSLMEVRAQEKALPLLVEFDGKMPAKINTDPTRLRQILINLLSNAIKFTESGTVRLLVRYLGEDEGRPILAFDVIDTGIGISEQQIASIFRPFSQVDASLTRQFEGTGLGLTISRRLAEMLDGEIKVTSQPGEGSSFSLTLNTGVVDQIELVDPSTEIISRDPDSGIPRRDLDGRILVVDDRRDIRYLAQYFLEEAGASVMSAEHGRAALDMVKALEKRGETFDLILMDMQMPVLDGYAATRALRERGFSNPIIALTAGAMRKDRSKSMNAGCDAHVAKPIDGVALVNLVAHFTYDISPDELQRKRDRRAANAGQPEAESASGTPDRVLVVDDSKDSAEALVRLLQMSGFEASCATTGSEALEMAAEINPQAVILDIGLPDINGYEVGSRISAADGTKPLLIALSGREGDAQKLRQSGFKHHMMKPADISRLVQLLKES